MKGCWKNIGNIWHSNTKSLLKSIYLYIMVFKIGKSDEEKILEKRSKISMFKATVNRQIRQYEKILEKSREDAKLALRQNNMMKAKLFASFMNAIQTSINGLKDYSLLLESVDLNLMYSLTLKQTSSSIIQSSEALKSSELTPQQIADMSKSLNELTNAQERIQSTLVDQFDQIKDAVEQTANISTANPEKILESLSREMSQKSDSMSNTEMSGSESSKEDEELNKLLKEMQDNPEK